MYSKIQNQLETYLSKSSKKLPKNYDNGIPTDWMFINELIISSDTIWFGDPYVANDTDGYLGKVKKGNYLIEAQGFDYEGFRVIGKLRARLEGNENFQTGDKVGETGTDSALIAVCDIVQLDEAVANENEQFQNFIDNFEFERFGIIEFEMSKPIKIVYANSGFGDGLGPVFEILDKNNNRIGFELDFLGED